VTALDPDALDVAARTYAACEGWHYMPAEATGPEHLTRAAAVVTSYLDAAADDQPIGTRHFLPLPYDRPPKGLTANGSHGNYHAKAADTKRVRAAVTRLAAEAGIQPCAHLTVWLYWAPGDRRRRDADNLWPLLKVCCDALAKGPRKDWVGLELVPDDTPQYMTKRSPRILTPDETTERGLWLIVDALDTAPDTVAPERPQPGPGRPPNEGAAQATLAHISRTPARQVDVPAKDTETRRDEMRATS